MRTHFGLPTCNYNIVLSNDDLEQLLQNGHISVRVVRTKCTTSRLCLNENQDGFDVLDNKEIYNDLRFYLDESVADLPGGDWSVQFLDIVLDKDCDIGNLRGIGKE